MREGFKSLEPGTHHKILEASKIQYEALPLKVRSGLVGARAFWFGDLWFKDVQQYVPNGPCAHVAFAY